jgi:hypothetical protein
MTPDVVHSSAVASEATSSNTLAPRAENPAPFAPARPGRAAPGGASRRLLSPTAGLRLLWAVIRFVLVSYVFVFGKSGKNRRR